MRRYIVRRLTQLIPMLLLVTFISYGLMLLAPGGPEQVLLGDSPRIDPARMAALRRKWGLDDPIPIQYARWLGHVVQGDLGESYYHGKAVADLLMERLPATLELNLTALILSWALALPLGVLGAARQHSVFDHLATALSSLGQAMPTFWIGLMLVVVALHSGGIIPPGGYSTPGVTVASAGLLGAIADQTRYLLLPTLTLTLSGLATLVRYTRSSMLEVLREDYIRAARAKGLTEKVVLYRHAFRNASLPVITLTGTLIATLLGGAAVTEQVFAWPGLGQLAIDAIAQRYYPVVMGFLLTGALLSAASYLLVDIAYVLADPRIRFN